MASPCHPAPPGPAGGHADPYAVLGLHRNATAAQIKTAYRKLALAHHPDRVVRRRSSSLSPPPPDGKKVAGNDASGRRQSFNAAAESAETKESTDKFAEISAAYAILSDPERRAKYDHLKKLGAFDDDSGNRGGSGGGNGNNWGNHDFDGGNGNNGDGGSNANASGYQYAEDYSGGYYRKDYVPPPEAAAPSYARFNQQAAQQAAQRHAAYAAAAAAAFREVPSVQSVDSFFDDLIYSPRSRRMGGGGGDGDGDDNNDRNGDGDPNGAGTDPDGRRKRPPGVGFSLAPLGTHLSVHVPSRNEILASVLTQSHGRASANGGDDEPRGHHLFGTRVTFTSSQRRTAGGGLASVANCGERREETVIRHETTRIARGRRRSVRRTARLRPDGTREVVVEEDGVVRRRYVEGKGEGKGEAGDEEDVEDDGDGKPDGRGVGRRTEEDEKAGEGSSDRKTCEGTDEGGDEEGGLQREGGGNKFTLLGMFRSCLAPCSSIGAG